MTDMLVILGSDRGKATAGATLIAKTGGVRYNHAQPTSYRWLRDNVAISDATGNLYIVQPEDVGSDITLQFMFNGDRMVEADPIFITDPHIEAVAALYPYAFGRDPDRPGLLFWADYLRSSEISDPAQRLASLATEFGTSPTYQASLHAL